MKRSASLGLAVGLLLTPAVPPAFAQSIEVRSESIGIQYDNQFHQQVRWLQDQRRNFIVFDPAVQESIEVNGWECAEFVIDAKNVVQRRIEDTEFGQALEGIMVGVLRDQQKQIALERHVRLLLPDRFADVVIFEKSYQNLGAKPVHFGRVYSQRVLLDRTLAEPEQPSYLFASFQGGAYKWGKDYSLIWLNPGFRQLNFQGMDERTGPEGEGGGMPFVDLWAPSMGLALVHLEKVPQWVNLPVEVRQDGKVETAIWEQPLGKFNQQEWLAPGERFNALTTAMIFHHGDYYDALHTYGELLRARGIAIPTSSPASAYQPYWKSWGFEADFTQEKIFGVLPELKAMGIKIANLDDAWFDYYGDWQPNRSPGKFPAGDSDIKAFVKRLHAEGFKTSPWWYPLGVSTNSQLASSHPELLVQDENGNYPVDDRKVRQLCPAFEPARRQIAGVLDRFIRDWEFDGIYVDGIGLSAVPPCFNQAHRHRSPLESFQSLPEVFRLIHDNLHKLNPDPYLEVCVCAMPHSPYNMPYYPIANASDPTNLVQVRRRVKLEKAIRGPTFCVGDCYQVPMNEWKGYSVPESFESAMGTGAQLTTFYAHLTDPQREKWIRWFRLSDELGLSSGEYLNLYDIAFDKPEIHVVRKGKDLFYGIFADLWPLNRPIELRGLSKSARYAVYDYANDRPLGVVSGAKPHLSIAFKDSLLLRVRPQ
ncbi:MAG: alpha-galactosidase [Verrucomicrobia bacterium]|nr:alpha-galactosidase [Verrucomicrobiota bacterium]